MSRQIQVVFGRDRSTSFEIDETCDLYSFQPQGAAVADPAVAAYEAVVNPIAYPPLASACVPGDRVVIAVDRDVPQASAVVQGVIRALAEGAEVQTTVLCASSNLATELRAELEESVCVESHDPNDQDQLSYLAALKDGQPLYLGRLLQESDVVIPIGALRPASSFGYGGVGSCLYPAFSNAAAQAGFRRAGGDRTLGEEVDQAPSQAPNDNQQQQLRFAQAAEAAWLLGAQFTVQVLPGRSGSVQAVLAGDCQQVEVDGAKACETAWTFETPTRTPLVVCAIDGGPEQQTWDNFARALDAANQVAEDDADILICTELTELPGPALLELGGELVDDELSRELQRSRDADAGVASLLWSCLQNTHVHLISDLPEPVVYGLGMTPVSEDELAHVVGRHRQFALIHSAHRAAVIQRQSDNVFG